MARFDSEPAVVDATYTRPSNTTQYAANDALSDSTSAPSALTFSDCARSKGAGGWILGVTCITSANQSTLPELTLYLFDGSSAPTATNDNAEFNLSDADANNLLGTFVLDNFEAVDETSGADGNAKCEKDTSDGRLMAFRCADTVRDLYGLVKVENAYTPVSAEAFKFRLHILQG